MSDVTCNKCGKELRISEVFGDLWHTYCLSCWKLERPEEAERTPTWYRSQLSLLKHEKKSLRAAFDLLERKHNHLHGEYYQFYDMFGIRKEAGEEEEE